MVLLGPIFFPIFCFCVRPRFCTMRDRASKPFFCRLFALVADGGPSRHWHATFSELPPYRWSFCRYPHFFDFPGQHSPGLPPCPPPLPPYFLSVCHYSVIGSGFTIRAVYRHLAFPPLSFWKGATFAHRGLIGSCTGASAHSFCYAVSRAALPFSGEISSPCARGLTGHSCFFGYIFPLKDLFYVLLLVWSWACTTLHHGFLPYLLLFLFLTFFFVRAGSCPV